MTTVDDIDNATLVFDPNTLSRDGTVAVNGYAFNWAGSLIAYNIARCACTLEQHRPCCLLGGCAKQAGCSNEARGKSVVTTGSQPGGCREAGPLQRVLSCKAQAATLRCVRGAVRARTGRPSSSCASTRRAGWSSCRTRWSMSSSPRRAGRPMTRCTATRPQASTLEAVPVPCCGSCCSRCRGLVVIKPHMWA